MAVRSAQVRAGRGDRELVADVKGLHIESSGGTRWSTTDGSRTHFKGKLRAGDLAKVLPQWNYAPSLETTSPMWMPTSLARFAVELCVVGISRKAVGESGERTVRRHR